MRFQIGSRSRRHGGRQAGGGCLIAFGAVFAGFGLLFVSLLMVQLVAEVATYRWDEVPCEIDSIEIVAEESNRDEPFRMVAKYRFRHEGQWIESTQYSLQGKREDDYETLALQRKALLEAGAPVCYVNPEAPVESVLKREALTTGAFVLLPLVFVAVGFGIMWGGFAMRRKEKAAERRAGGKASISAAGSTSPGGGRKVGVAIGVVFSLIGLGVFIGMLVGPLQRMHSSRNWVETPCQVIWSRVLSHDSDDGTTYSVDIFYEYEFGGQTHRSNRYQGMSGSSSGRSGKSEVVRQYPAGSERVCFVNPEVPEQAILVPGFTAWALFALLPLLFLLIGVAVLSGSLRSGEKRGTVGSDRSAPGTEGGGSSTAGGVGQESGPLVFSPSGRRLAKLGCLLFFALFWNGIVSIFLVEIIQGWRSGKGDIIPTIFMIPFVVIGLGVIALLFYQVLASFNPRPVLTLPGGTPRVGDRVTVHWKVSGPISRIVQFRISLWGIESATYRRGTDTVTTSRVFLDLPLVDTAAALEISQGSATLELPGDLMYSLDLSNNDIKYELRVQGEIPLWPDISDQYPLTLKPASLSPG